MREAIACMAATHTEIDWVFLGMCPASLRRYAAEFHEMVPVEDYPAKLASLALDAAVAPIHDRLDDLYAALARNHPNDPLAHTITKEN